MKKLFPENKVSRKGLLEFLDKKGFYIILILCIAVVGVTAILVTTHNITSSNPDYDAKSIVPDNTGNKDVLNAHENTTAQSSVSTPTAKTGTTDPKVASANTTSPAKTVASSNTGKETASANTGKSTTAAAKPASTKPAAQAPKQDFAMPVFGDVSYAYAMDKLTYSKTLEDWRVHQGVDLAAGRGTNVKAVADGIVTDVKSDPLFGIVVVIDHQNGLRTVYANLASDEMASPNQIVKKGDIIGCVGNTAISESAEQPHLHFEVLKNNVWVDPMSYLPKTNLPVKSGN